MHDSCQIFGIEKEEQNLFAINLINMHFLCNQILVNNAHIYMCAWVDRKVLMMTSYLLLTTFFINRIQALRQNVLRTSIDKIKENGFKLTKERSRRYPAKTITDTDYANDIVLLANAPAQAKTLLHSLE